MSRVTFIDLYFDYVSDETPLKDYKQVQSVEIVPRKIVEMIIEKAKEEGADVNNSYYSRKINNIWEYAEKLLKQFEEDE